MHIYERPDRPWIKDKSYYVAPLNYHEKVAKQRVATEGTDVSAQLYDSTIRKVLLTPGLRPTIHGMVRIAELLEGTGVKHLTSNIHWWKDSQPEALEWAVAEAILKANFSFDTSITLDTAWSDDWRRGVEDLAELGMNRPVFLFQPTREDRGNRSSEETHDRVREIMGGIKDMGLRPGLMITDAGRASWEDLVGLSRAGIEAGADLLNLTDSGSSLSHHGMKVLLNSLRRELDTDVEFLVHTHDDFGLGTPIAIETVLQGDSIELSFNGISDRAGFPSFEETIVCLESMYGLPSGYDMKLVSQICELVKQESIAPHPWKALSGDHAFMLDLPYSAAPALEKGRGSFPPVWNCVDPSWLGYAPRMNWLRQFMYGPVVEAKLRSLGLPTDEEATSEFRAVLSRELASMKEYPIWVKEEAFDELAQLTLGERGK